MRLLAANLLAVAVLLLLFEGIIRWTHPEIGPLGTDRQLVQDSAYGSVAGLRPGASGRSNGVLFQIDSAGYIRYSRTAASPSASWLLLGDSVTMGLGVAPDSTFAGRLSAESSLRLLNASLIGYDAADYHALLAQHLAAPDPARPPLTRVTVFWCLNDIYPEMGRRVAPGHSLRRLAGPVMGVVRRHLRSYQWLKKQVADRPHAYFEHDRAPYQSAALDSAVARLAGMRDLAAAHAVRFDVVLLPYEYQLREPSAATLQPQRALSQALSKRGIYVLDVARHLAAGYDAPADLYAYGDGIHFSTTGHRAVADVLRRRLIVPEPGPSLTDLQPTAGLQVPRAH